MAEMTENIQPANPNVSPILPFTEKSILPIPNLQKCLFLHLQMEEIIAVLTNSLNCCENNWGKYE